MTGTDNKTPGGRLHAWMELVRIPNLLTVPGDPLAGYFLTRVETGAANAMISAIATSLLLYAGGMIMNDLFDKSTDARERPARPLPSGRITTTAAIAVMLLMMCGALLVAWCRGAAAGLTATTLATLILVYNAGLKKIPVIGALVMGGCRGLSLLVGTVIATDAFALPGNALCFALLIMAYIAAVTLIARHETGAAPIPVILRFLPSVILLAGLLFMILATGPAEITPHGSMLRVAFPLLSAITIVISFLLGAKLAPGKNIPVPQVIGGFIGVMILLQAAICMASAHAVSSFAAGLLIISYFMFGRGVRRIAAS